MSPEKKGHKILFIEDQPDRADLIRASFQRSGGKADLLFAASASAGLELLKQRKFDALFFKKQGCTSHEFDSFCGIKGNGNRDIAIIMVCDDGEEDTLQAITRGIDETVQSGPGFIDSYSSTAARSVARRRALPRERELSREIIESRKQWMSIIDAITDYIFVVDDEHKLLKVNSAFARAYDMHPRQLVGKKCTELFGTDILSDCALTDIQHDGKPRTYEKTIGDDTYQISIFPLSEGDRNLTIHVMKNITELRRLKEQLHHADKLASIGLLVSGVAHEINNPLTGTIAYTELLGMKVVDDGVKQDLKKILESAERCKKIVDNLLTFSRQRTPSKSLESVNEIVDRAVDLRNYWLRSSGIEIVRDYDPVTTVFVDAQQLQQVMLNILLNAEQAIVGSGQGKGKITFTTRQYKDERLIRIRIADNGPGIPQRVISRIFDPFFTTKPVGVGTGLGLSISHGIITEHGGTIGAENPEGGGAAFTIELPTGAGSIPGAPGFRENGQVR